MKKITTRKLDSTEAEALRAAIKADPVMVRSSAVLTAWRRALAAGVVPCVTKETEPELLRALGGMS